jgi:hypothetical protein
MGIFGIAKKGFGMLGRKAKVSPTITGVKPKSKIKGSKSVGDMKTRAGISKMKAAGFSLNQTIKKTGENIDKLNKSMEKNIKILRSK